MGSKKRPFYRIIATDSRNPRDGRFIETLGYYNPLTDPPDINVKEDLVFKWMQRGAVPTDNTESLLRRTGTMKRWSLVQQGVAVDALDQKVEELSARETQPMSAEDRRKKAEAGRKAAETATAAVAAAEESAATAEPAAEAAPAEGAPADDAEGK
jgi:small subunit ribosomal protein S16